MKDKREEVRPQASFQLLLYARALPRHSSWRREGIVSLPGSHPDVGGQGLTLLACVCVVRSGEDRRQRKRRPKKWNLENVTFSLLVKFKINAFVSTFSLGTSLLFLWVMTVAGFD